jgi:hypothetical protein
MGDRAGENDASHPIDRIVFQPGNPTWETGNLRNFPKVAQLPPEKLRVGGRHAMNTSVRKGIGEHDAVYMEADAIRSLSM